MIRTYSFIALLLSLALLSPGCQSSVPTPVDRGYTSPMMPSVSATRTQSTQTTQNEVQWQTARPTVPATSAIPSTSATRPPARTSSSRSASADGSNIIFQSQQIKVSKDLLQANSVGGEVRYRIRVEALDALGTVRVNEALPAGIAFVSAQPSPAVSGSNLSWTFPSMSKGQTEDIAVSVRPTREGDHQICSTVTIDNRFCLDLFAGQPRLNVVKKGPESVELGEIVTWTVTVTNQGSAAATNVVVTDRLPAAFSPTTDLRQNVGTLAPGESRTVEYSARATQQGEFRNQAVASFDGSGPDGTGEGGTSADSSIPIRVVQSGIRVRKSGPAEAYVFKPETFEIRIENTGDTDLQNVRITDILPEGASVADNGGGRVSRNAIGWMIPTLPAGASQLITTEIAATRTGTATNTVKVVSANGLEASDAVNTNWLAVPGVTISITDSKDPIRVREATIYGIQVRNQGNFEPVTGTVTVRFTDGIKPTAVAGDAQGTIRGQTVSFPSTTLEPGRDTNLSITAEGASIGASRAVLSFSADFLADPIISQEATNVY